MFSKSSSLIAVCFMLSFASYSNASYYVCSSLELNIDYKGNDLAYSYAANTVQLCASLCTSLKSVCTGFTFWNYSTNQVCFLKNFTATPLRFPSQGRSSCIMVYVPSTTPAATSTQTASTTSRPITSPTATKITVTKSSATTASKTSTTATTILSTTSSTTTLSTTTGPSKCFTENEAFFGFSDSADVQSAQSVADCCDSCINAGTNCIAFSYLADQTICYIYSGTIQDKVSRANTTSGFANPDLTTTPTAASSTVSN